MPREGTRLDRARENEELLRRLDGFVRERYRGYEFNVLRNKYFVNERRMARQREHRVTGDTLSPYDHVVRPVAESAGFDWRLIVAKMYQESGFDPNRISFAGAEGLLQVLPRTARDLGVDAAKLKDPETGIAAGVAYLGWPAERFPTCPWVSRYCLRSARTTPGTDIFETGSARRANLVSTDRCGSTMSSGRC